MNKIVKTIFIFAIFLAAIPALAGWAIAWLWNAILVSVCGFAVIGFWQGVGLFLLGQTLTGGVVLGLFLFGMSFHRIMHHRDEWGSHWHNMTDEQRREFIERRRRVHFGFRNHENGAGE